MIDLKGKVAVVFGLANKRSIAWGIAQKLSEAGATLAICYQNERMKLEAEVMATALSVYVTNEVLAGGTVASQYGFTVTTNGLGVDTYNVGDDGAAVGQANGTTLTIMEILLAVDSLSAGDDGILYGGDKTLQGEANYLFSAINSAGNI